MQAGDWVFRTASSGSQPLRQLQPSTICGATQFATISILDTCTSQRQIRFVIAAPVCGEAGLAQKVVTETVKGSVTVGDDETELEPITRTSSKDMMKSEYIPLINAYRQKEEKSLLTSSTSLTVRRSRATGHAGLRAELWEHVANHGPLSAEEMHAALDALMPANHTLAVSCAEDRTLAEEQQRQEQDAEEGEAADDGDDDEEQDEHDGQEEQGEEEPEEQEEQEQDEEQEEQEEQDQDGMGWDQD